MVTKKALLRAFNGSWAIHLWERSDYLEMVAENMGADEAAECLKLNLEKQLESCLRVRDSKGNEVFSCTLRGETSGSVKAAIDVLETMIDVDHLKPLMGLMRRISLLEDKWVRL